MFLKKISETQKNEVQFRENGTILFVWYAIIDLKCSFVKVFDC